MNNRHLTSIFAAMQSTRLGALVAALNRNTPAVDTPEQSPEQSAKRRKRMELEAKAIVRSQSIIDACGPQKETRQVRRWKERRREFSDISAKYILPRKIRRAITRDKLKIDHARVKVAA
jgi:hypothetical protein